MSTNCNDTNPCNPCETSCFDNCGCINPTTFECVSNPGNCTALGVTDDMTGKEALAAMCLTMGDAIDDIGKVKVNGSDTCPEYLEDKLVAGLNISLTVSGTGCDKVITIDATEGGVPVDVNAKVSSDDTTTGYLTDKITTGTYLTKTIIDPSADESIELDVEIATLISGDAGNPLYVGTDGAIMSSCVIADGSETKVVAGTGVTVTGTGTVSDPIVVSTNPSISVVRSCFDSIWRDITLVGTGNANVVYVSGVPKYRYRFDGSIEFKGSATYTVAFGAYSTGNRKYTVPMGNIPTTCLTAGEQAGSADLKEVNYIDVPQASADQITQMYSYIIRKTTNNLILEFQSSFTASTSKTIVVNFEPIISHPTI